MNEDLTYAEMSARERNVTRIIACSVFRSSLESIKLESRYPNLRISYLPSDFHLRPEELKKHLQIEMDAARNRNERVICLYGECFPGISDVCREQGVIKVPGDYCYEMLLGTDRFKQFIDEIAGTYFAEKDLIINFEECCVIPLELNDEEMKAYCFEHYKRLLYIRQPEDPDILSQVVEVAEFLELSLDISDADYSHLEKTLTELI